MIWRKCKDCMKRTIWGVVGKSRVDWSPKTGNWVIRCLKRALKSMKRWGGLSNCVEKNEERLTVLVVSENCTRDAMIRREGSKKA